MPILSPVTKSARLPYSMLAIAMVFAPLAGATAATETVLHTFTGAGDGHVPIGALAMDAQGTLYGTTLEGGAENAGTVFILNAKGGETVRFSFGAGGIQSPVGGVVRGGKGEIFGTTSGLDSNLDGSVFRLGAHGNAKQLHLFGQTAGDGFYDNTGLTRDAAGNLYGTTYFGGASGDFGIVYKLSPQGKETILYHFQGGTDGQWPTGTPILDPAGNLYGVTQTGGSKRDGTVYKLTQSGTKTTLHGFAGPDGYYPIGALVLDAAGNLYGATQGGGAHGEGALFKVTPSGTETVLYSFTGKTDGANPIGPLVFDSAGTLYGTASKGGAGKVGTVYTLSPDGTFQTLYAFKGTGGDGAFPNGGLLIDAAGALYGTTQYGGGGANDGTVFKVIK